MKIRYLAIVPICSLAIACGGGSTPEPETPEAAEATEEAAPAEEPLDEGFDEAAPADDMGAEEGGMGTEEEGAEEGGEEAAEEGEEEAAE